MSGRSEMEALQELCLKPFDKPLCMLVAEIRYVMGIAIPCGEGSQQTLHVGSSASFIYDLMLYDHPETLSVQLAERGVIVLSASPESKKALVWHRKKAVKPALRQGMLSARPPVNVHVFGSVAEARAAGFARSGFVLSESVLARTPPVPAASGEVPPTASGPEKAKGAVVIGFQEREAEITQAFARCVRRAREELGKDASEADVKLVAEMTFGRLYGQSAASSA